jgi:hypothetical protein
MFHFYDGNNGKKPKTICRLEGMKEKKALVRGATKKMSENSSRELVDNTVSPSH